ncbi:hypothetical protein VIGAN_06129000 [Vigna angularis var. angularis]|uniref:Serine-threonine/tyrosine-protein kinase catalytic domain-containing protein n=1 Tax=Vigna angularis var. angularis TaxID=157739 RepID=A0A0S3SBE0_PHAAN|nr:hypothetical protein VIGAN_06129000 [Vigna angularis var. angularis]
MGPCDILSSHKEPDKQYNGKQSSSHLSFVALKIQKSAVEFVQAALHEIDILSSIAEYAEYGVVLLELITGRKLVDMSQPQGEENLVTWARPLLRYREGLEKVVDPFLAGKYDFNEMAKMAAITSLCVHPEVTQRPFMGEVVRALKLIYNDTNESEKESLCHELDFEGDLVFSDSSWLDGEGVTLRLTYGPESSLIT